MSFLSEVDLNKPKNNELRKFVWKLLGLIFAVAIGLGILAFKNYRTFEKQMLGAQAELRHIGGTQTFHQCLDRVVERVTQCNMTVLCIQGVPQLMGACLEPGEHHEECVAAQPEFSKSHFGYQDCIERGYTGKLKKICGSSYRAFADYCKITYFQGKL